MHEAMNGSDEMYAYIAYEWSVGIEHIRFIKGSDAHSLVRRKDERCTLGVVEANSICILSPMTNPDYYYVHINRIEPPR